MFGFGRKAKVDRVYRLLNEHFASVSTKKAEMLVEREALEELFDLCGDVDTTVVLVLLRQQAVVAEGMKDKAPYEQIAQEIIEHARKDGISPEKFVRDEADAQVESAKAYSDRISEMLNSGQLVANEDVRRYCAENAVAMLASWQIYRLRLLSAMLDQIGRGPP
jgi:hypothetical protein